MIATLALLSGLALAFAVRHRAEPRRDEKGVESAGNEIDFELDVRDEHGVPSPCRVHLRGADGMPWTSSQWPAYDDHFVFPGKGTLTLPEGPYTYEIERGPEYRRLTGSFRAADGAPMSLRLQLVRLADLASEGWYSGDLHIHRRPEDVELLMRAEDLYVGPVVTWWNSEAKPPPSLPEEPYQFDGSRFMHPTAGEDERQGGALLFFRLTKPLVLPPSMRNDAGVIIHREGVEDDEYPAPAELAKVARAEPTAHIDIEKPFWWDVPSWVALGFADSIAIAYNQMTRTSLHNGEAWGKGRDQAIYDGPFGDAYWTQDIYYRILDSGIRLAPSAGSASGALPNPVGYDRVYVHLDGPLRYDAWWQGLKAGRSFVTNGPLLLVRANGELPGHVFQSGPRATIDVRLETRFLSNDPVAKLELVRDGRVVDTRAPDADGGAADFGTLTFKRSGWFLVRALASRRDTFRFASTAPFYVEVGDKPRRISRGAVQFFIDWIEERMHRLESGTMPKDKLASVMAFQQEAERFWRGRLASANSN